MENNKNTTTTKHWQFAIRVIRNGYASRTIVRNWMMDCMANGSLAVSPTRLSR